MMQFVEAGILMVEAFAALVLLGLLTAARHVQAARRARRAAEAAAGGPVREALAVYLGGNSDLVRLKDLARQYPVQVEETILAFQGKLGGRERARLGLLAYYLGFVAGWCEKAKSTDPAVRRTAFARIAALSHCEAVRQMSGGIPMRGLKDPDAQVRLEAVRALIHSEEKENINLAFEAALAATPLARLQLAPLLRRHAFLLCEEAIPRALRAGPVPDLLKALRLLCSWECSLPLDDLSEPASHPNSEVRKEALRLLAMLPPTPENRRAVLANLVEEDTSVAMAAVATVGRLRLPAALPRVTSCLRRGDEKLARAAARVLADMPPVGWQALEDQVRNPDPIASRAAREALEACGAGIPALVGVPGEPAHRHLALAEVFA